MMNCDRESVYDRYEIPYYLMLPASLIFGAFSYVYLILNTSRTFVAVALWVAHILGLLHDVVML